MTASVESLASGSTIRIRSGLSAAHAALALAVVAVWGTNFVVIKAGLGQFPPFLFATLRFVFCCLPWIFFIPRPAVGFRKLAAFGVLQGAGQFGLLYYAMQADISPGVASLVVQSQVFFTIGAAVVWLGETIKALQAFALAIALIGIGIIAWHSMVDPTTTVTIVGLSLTLLAGLSWTVANFVARSAGRVNMLHFMIWSSIFSVPPLFALSLIFDPPGSQFHALTSVGAMAWIAVLWQSLGNTLFGFASWNWLLARYESASVTPIALLVPVFGISASGFLLGEALPPWKIAAAALVLIALGINTYAAHRGRLSK